MCGNWQCCELVKSNISVDINQSIRFYLTWKQLYLTSNITKLLAVLTCSLDTKHKHVFAQAQLVVQY